MIDNPARAGGKAAVSTRQGGRKSRDLSNSKSFSSLVLVMARTAGLILTREVLGELLHYAHVRSAVIPAGKIAFAIYGSSWIHGVGDPDNTPDNAVQGCVETETGSLIDSFEVKSLELFD